MAQCQEDTGRSWVDIKGKKLRSDITWSPSYNFPCCVVTVVTATEEAGIHEAIWTVQVVALTEIHMRVTVRYDHMSVRQIITVAQRRSA